MFLYLLLLVVLLIIAIYVNRPVYTQEDSAKSYAYARELYQNGLYEQAISAQTDAAYVYRRIHV